MAVCGRGVSPICRGGPVSNLTGIFKLLFSFFKPVSTQFLLSEDFRHFKQGLD